MGIFNSKPCPPGPTVYTPGPTVYTPGPTVYTPGEKVYTPGEKVYTPGPTVYTPGPTVYTPGPPGPTVYTPGPTVYTPGATVYTPGEKVYVPCPNTLEKKEGRDLSRSNLQRKIVVWNDIKNNNNSIFVEVNGDYPSELSPTGYNQFYLNITRDSLIIKEQNGSSVTFNPDTFKDIKLKTYSSIYYRGNGQYEIIDSDRIDTESIKPTTSTFGAMNNNNNCLMWIIIALIVFYFYKKSKGGNLNLFGKRRHRR